MGSLYSLVCCRDAWVCPSSTCAGSGPCPETFKLFWGQFDETSRDVTQGQSYIVWDTWLGLCVDPSEVFSQQLVDVLSVLRFNLVDLPFPQ